MLKPWHTADGSSTSGLLIFTLGVVMWRLAKQAMPGYSDKRAEWETGLQRDEGETKSYTIVIEWHTYLLELITMTITVCS